MKTFLTILAAVGAFATAGLFAQESAPQQQQRAIGLQVTASLPASANVIRDADIAEAFGYMMCTKLHEQGYRGRIAYVDDVKQVAPNLPHLALNLMEWRVDPLGNVDCTFNATLTTARGTKSLGIFTGTSLIAWPFGSWSARDAAFERAAASAVTDLLKKMRESNLLPDAV